MDDVVVVLEDGDGDEVEVLHVGVKGCESEDFWAGLEDAVDPCHAHVRHLVGTCDGKDRLDDAGEAGPPDEAQAGSLCEDEEGG